MDTIQKTIAGVLGISGILALIVPTTAPSPQAKQTDAVKTEGPGTKPGENANQPPAHMQSEDAETQSSDNSDNDSSSSSSNPHTGAYGVPIGESDNADPDAGGNSENASVGGGFGTVGFNGAVYGGNGGSSSSSSSSSSSPSSSDGGSSEPAWAGKPVQ